MTDSQPDDATTSQRKQALRELVRARRRELADPHGKSAAILERLTATVAWRGAGSILFYVGVRDEIRTLPLLERTLENGRAVAVPYCQERRLELFSLRSLAELAPGAYGIPEPLPELRSRADRRIDPASIQLALTPGLAFDRRGGRLGYGGGYYDRLLPRLGSDCLKVALAYRCQIVDETPVEPHDVRVDWIVCEEEVIDCRSAG